VPRILVVDDQPDSLLAARAALVGAGHDCVLAAAGSTRGVAVTGAGTGLADGRVAARLPKPVSPARLVAAVAYVLTR